MKKAFDALNEKGLSYEFHDYKKQGIDPKTGKTYKLKGELAEGGKKLNIRGYIGISALGRNQTWIRAN